ncbi:MAG: TPM domain-containing protein [Oscillospiraceae bacterium]|nr:TPM domain-containing protein [Oscillospiraceae bacterium]
MKKLLSLLLSGIICSVLAFSACAEFVNPPVVDGAGYLTEEQFIDISERLDEVREKYDCEVAVYTEASMSGYDAMSTADDIYDYKGYGAGETYDGILLYISANPREYWFTTYADGTWAFNAIGIDYLKSRIQPLLAADDYYGAMLLYAELADEFLEMAANGNPYNETEYDTEYTIVVLLGALLIPLAIAFVMMLIKLAQMKTAVAQDRAGNYMKPEGLRLNASRDIFLYSHITKRARPKNNSSGTHTSSSGRSHGGGGGSF